MIGGSRLISLKVDADAGIAISRDAVSMGLIVYRTGDECAETRIPRRENGCCNRRFLQSRRARLERLTFSDNGIGKPDVNASQTKPGLGTSLVKALTRQLEAVVDIVSGPRGTAVSVTHATFKANPS